MDVLLFYRTKKNYLLHEFVVMPDHAHLLLTPANDISLEKAVQLIKGGFSFRAKKELGYPHDIWERSFTVRRIESAQDYSSHARYISENPIKARLAKNVNEYAYSSLHYELDAAPPWVKPFPKGISSADG